MIEANEQKTILVLGGYGAVGSVVCEELARNFAGRIIVAGRNLQQAERLAQQLGGRVEAVQVDAAQPVAYRYLLSKTSVVVNCVEYNNIVVARECLRQAAHYVEVSATAQILAQIETLQAEAEQGRATAVLSVGVAPGLTNLLAHHARLRLGPLVRADLFVLLGLGEAHGEAAIRWMLQNMGRSFTLGSENTGQQVRSFVEGRATKMPPPFGRRAAYRFDFSDQHTLPRTLGIQSVNTWLCFDSRLVTCFFGVMASLRLLSVLPLWRVSGSIARLSLRFTFGSKQFVVQVDAVSSGGKKGSFALIGDGETHMTGLVAAHVARHLLSSPTPPGILHIEQILSLASLLSKTDGRLRLVER